MELGNTARGRGRPRGFDMDEAVATAQALFHERGYDELGVAELSGAMGIRAPSFYAAFGSKAGLFARALDRYVAGRPLPFPAADAEARPLAEALERLLIDAAILYTGDPARRGCLALEGMRCGDPDARAAAAAACGEARSALADLLAPLAPAGEPLVEFVMVTLAGLSAQARRGADRQALLGAAGVAVNGLRPSLARAQESLASGRT